MLDILAQQQQRFMNLTVTQWALAGSAVAFIYAVQRWRKLAVQKNKRRGAERVGAPGPRAEETAGGVAGGMNVRDVTTHLHAILGDMEEASRRLTAQLDNRYQKLEQLIVEADERIKKLEGMVKAGQQAPAAGGAQVAMVSEAERMLQRLRQERGAPAPMDDPAYQPIYVLADGGKTSREIAQELGRQPGEIELILALRQRQRAG